MSSDVSNTQNLVSVRADGQDQQSCGDGDVMNFSRLTSNAVLQISEFCRQMEDLTVDEVWLDLCCIISL